MSSSEKDSVVKETRNEAVKTGDEIFERITYMSTLPRSFKSLAGKIVKIEKEEPRCIIELLGDLLGITDYKINKAAFWFLDTIALYVLRYKNRLDDYYRGVLISWLAGEMILIRDKQLLREDFFKEMKMLFFHIAEKLSSGDQLPHWELLVDEYFKITSKNPIIDKSIKREAEYSVINESSAKELITDNEKDASQENTRIFIEKNLIKTRDSGNKQSVTNLEKKPSNNFRNSLNIKKSQTDTFASVNTVTESFKLETNIYVMDIIIEATYSMYANELRYALIYAVFVTPIPTEIYYLPALRIPRRIKLVDLENASFDLLLYERLKTFANVESKIDTGKRYKGQRNNAKKAINDINAELPPTPTSSLSDEEMLAYNRQFILPLMEAKETARMFGIYAGDA